MASLHLEQIVLKHLSWLVSGCICLASFLLFVVEPMAAKELLPALGGSAAVWITCLVFFQSTLLLGYAYAHWAATSPRVRVASAVHIALLALAAIAAVVWAIRPMRLAGVAAHPFLDLLLALTAAIGLPFAMLASTSTLLQGWLGQTGRRGLPYRLYALSNAASLLALALYPAVIEPHFSLHAQRMGWAAGFVCVGAPLVVLTRAFSNRSAVASTAVDATPPDYSASRRDKLLWLLLPMVGAMQLSSVTEYITANIAAVPLLWVLPLSVYLVTLIVAFAPRGDGQGDFLIPRGLVLRFLSVMLAGLAYLLSRGDVTLPISLSMAFFLLELFFASLFCHTEAYALRPRSPRELTMFYLLFAAGGALGAFLIGIVAPLATSANYDLPVTFLATALVALLVTWRMGPTLRLLWSVGSVLLVYILVLLHLAYVQQTLVSVRNFYGTLRVKQADLPEIGPMRTLTHGTIQHGTQIFAPELMHTPTTYYAEDSGIGLALRYCCGERPRSIGVVGLGTGTIAAYGRPGDRIRFYELNPAVLPIAQHLFTYLRDSRAAITFAAGDARASLTRETPQQFDVLAIDAFSGDAIPIHLLTREALDVYQRQLAPDGILAFHISNQHVNLAPELALLAESAGLTARTVVSGPHEQLGEFRATWVLMTRNEPFLHSPELTSVLHPTEEQRGLRLWTDDDSSLLPLLH